jgi:hypothetical protein
LKWENQKKKVEENVEKDKKDKGPAVAQLVEALRYKPAGRGFNSRWCHGNFSFP